VLGKESHAEVALEHRTWLFRVFRMWHEACLTRLPMGRLHTVLVVLCCSTASHFAFGQTAELPAGAPPTSRAMTLPDALAYAHAHQPTIRASVARVAARIEEAKVPNGQWLPFVGVTGQVLGGPMNNSTASYVASDTVEIPRIGGTSALTSVSSTSWKPYASTFLGAGIRQEAFDFGRISAERAAVEELVEVQRQAAAVTLLDVDFGVEEAYFAVFAAKGVLKAADDAYTRAKTHRDLAKAGVDSGLRSPIELTRQEAELARYDIGRIRAAGGVALAETVLAASIGAPDATVDVVGEAPRASDMPSLQDAMHRAAAQDPRVRQALAQIKADEERTCAIGAELRPNVYLTGLVSGRAGGAPTSTGATLTGDGWLPYVPNWDVGLIIDWPIFDGTIIARKDAARTTEQVAREDLDVVRQQRVATIERTFTQFEVAKQALPGLQQAVTAAHANYDQADARFRAGLGNAVELADAEDLRASSEINLALGQFDVASTRAAFGRAIAEGL
jgi:outer membrane protein